MLCFDNYSGLSLYIESPFDRNSNYNDGFYYEGWEGHYELVKLNLDNPEVQQYLFDSVTLWIRQFDIDGIRLDVAYSLPRWFMAKLKAHCENLKKDFFLVGEVMGDNAGYMFSEAHLDSITDYPGFKGMWSSFNTMNMFELAHTLKRNYGEMYKGKDLLTFVDNHDTEPTQSLGSFVADWFKPLAYTLILLRNEGYPCVFYGDYYGIAYENISAKKELLDKLLYLRKNYCYDYQDDYFDDPHIIGWIKKQDFYHDPVIVIMSNRQEGQKEMYIGENFTGMKFYDFLGHIDTPVVINSSGKGVFKTQGKNVSVYIKQS